MKELHEAKVDRMVTYVKRELRNLERLYQKRDFEGISCLFGDQAVLVRTRSKRAYAGRKRIAGFFEEAHRQGITKVKCEVLRIVPVPLDFLLAEKTKKDDIVYDVYAAYDFAVCAFGVFHFIKSAKRNQNGDFLLTAGHRVVCRGELLGLSVG